MGSNLKINVAAFDKATQVIKKVSENLKKAGKEADKANRKFSKMSMKLKQIGRNAQKMGRSFKNVGKNLTRSVTMPVAAVGGGILRMAFNFQKSMNKVGAVTRTVVGGKVTPEFESLQKLALDLGAATEFSASQVAEAMANLGRAGFKPEEIEQATESILALATATGVGIDEAADVAATAIRAFGLAASDAARVSDVFALASSMTNTSLETIAETMKFVAPIAKTYGASIEEATALTGLLGDVGIKGSLAGTTLKNMFLNLSTPTSKATAMLRDLNIKTEDGAGGMRKLTDVLVDLAPKLKKLPKSKQLEVLKELFGKRAIAGGAALIDKLASGDDKLLKLIEQLNNANGSAKQMQETMNMGIVGAMNRFNSALEGAAIAIAKSGLLEFFQEVVTKFTDWFTAIRKTNPELLNLGVKLAGILAVAGPLLIVLGSVFSAVGTGIIAFAQLKIALGATTVAAGGMSLAMAPLLIGVAKFAAVSYGLIKTWGFLKKLVIDTKNSLSKEEKQKSRVAVLEQIKRQNNGVLPEWAKSEMTSEDVGAMRVKQKADNRNFIERTNNAKVMVAFKNTPPGTYVETKKDKELDLNVLLNGQLGY